jgi:hypothetical protein
MWKLLNALMVALIALFYVAVVVAALVALVGAFWEGGWSASPLLVLGMAAAFYGALAVHETGHLLAALAVRFRPRSAAATGSAATR